MSTKHTHPLVPTFAAALAAVALAFAGPAGSAFLFVVARQMVRAGFAGIDGDER